MEIQFPPSCLRFSGYTMNKAALKALVVDGFPNYFPHAHTFSEDTMVAKVFRKMGVYPYETKDENGSERYMVCIKRYLPANCLRSSWTCTHISVLLLIAVPTRPSLGVSSACGQKEGLVRHVFHQYQRRQRALLPTKRRLSLYQGWYDETHARHVISFVPWGVFEGIISKTFFLPVTHGIYFSLLSIIDAVVRRPLLHDSDSGASGR